MPAHLASTIAKVELGGLDLPLGNGAQFNDLPSVLLTYNASHWMAPDPQGLPHVRAIRGRMPFTVMTSVNA
jgi:hypothetical protein